MTSELELGLIIVEEMIHPIEKATLDFEQLAGGTEDDTGVVCDGYSGIVDLIQTLLAFGDEQDRTPKIICGIEVALCHGWPDFAEQQLGLFRRIVRAKLEVKHIQVHLHLRQELRARRVLNQTGGEKLIAVVKLDALIRRSEERLEVLDQELKQRLTIKSPSSRGLPLPSSATIAWLKMHDSDLNGQMPSLTRVVDALHRCQEWENHEAFVVDYIQEARCPFHLEWLDIAHATPEHEVLLLSILCDLAINAAFNVHQSEAQARLHLIAVELREIHIEQSHTQGCLAEAAARDSGNPAVFAARQDPSSLSTLTYAVPSRLVDLLPLRHRDPADDVSSRFPRAETDDEKRNVLTAPLSLEYLQALLAEYPASRLKTMPYMEVEAVLTHVVKSLYLLNGDLVWQTDTAIRAFFQEAASCLVAALVLLFRCAFAVTSRHLRLYVVERTFLANPESVDVETAEARLRVAYFELDWYRKIEPFHHPHVADYSREIRPFLEFLGARAGEGCRQTTSVVASSSPTRAEQAEELVEAVAACEVPSSDKGKDHPTPKKVVKKEPAPVASSGHDESDSSNDGEGEVVPEDEEVASTGDSAVPGRKPTACMSASRKRTRAQDEEEEEEEDELDAEEDLAPPRKHCKELRLGGKSRDSKLSMQDLIRIAGDCGQCRARTLGNQIGAMYNGVSFSLRDPCQLSLEDRLRAVRYIKAFERNPHQFLKVDRAGLQRCMHPDRICSRTPCYFFTEAGPMRFPSYDASGRLTALYSDAPAEVAESPKKPSSTRKPVSSTKLPSSQPSSSAVTLNCADMVPQVRAIRDEYNKSSREIVGLLERLCVLAQREHRLTQLEFGTGIVDVPTVFSFSDIVREGGFSEHFLMFLVNE
ncbi:hypothetical protein C8Q80DRAFT_1124137 [Daedaleopsis nitida]|nr:hypothetical protein C8Q80DRAFT_1124135 [Daedaleopsis nitida]KAI0739812.1 hypothetical protein C8Q80DRAFT_1124137 [Daedaleopsis nitida]